MPGKYNRLPIIKMPVRILDESAIGSGRQSAIPIAT